MTKMSKQDLENMIKESVGGQMGEFIKNFRAEVEENQRKFADKIKTYQPQDVQKQVEKGIKAARYIRSLAVAKGDTVRAAQFAKDKLKDEVVSKALSESDFSSGGAVVFEEFASELIELLRAKAVVRASGATTLPMNSGSLTLPKQTGAGTASYIGENSNISPSEQTVGQIQMSAKKLAALTPISNDLLRDASIQADTMVRNDLLRVMALREDLAFLRDDGTQNKPKGLRYWAASGNVFASVGTTLANVTDDLTKAIRLIESANVDMATMGWIFTPRTKWYLMSLRDGNGNLVFKPEMDNGTLFGFPYRTTTQIPNNLGGGSNESEIYLADFSHAIIGENTSLQIDVFEGGAYYDGSGVVSGISADQTVIRSISRHDFAVRYDAAVAVITGVTYGA